MPANLSLAHTQTRVTKKHRLGQVEQKAAGGFLNNNYLPNWVIKYSAVRATIEGHGRPKLFLPSYVVFLSTLRSFHLNLLSSSGCQAFSQEVVLTFLAMTGPYFFFLLLALEGLRYLSEHRGKAEDGR